jgi:hypothetical protein
MWRDAWECHRHVYSDRVPREDRPAGVTRTGSSLARRPAMETTHQPSLVDLAQILFASPLQPLDRPTIAQVHGAVSWALRSCGGDCSRNAAYVAQEAGDHPELYQRRMRWALATVGEVNQPALSVAS